MDAAKALKDIQQLINQVVRKFSRRLRNVLPDALRSTCKKIFSRRARSRFGENAAVLINFAPMAQNLKYRRFQEPCLENIFLQVLHKADTEHSFAIA